MTVFGDRMFKEVCVLSRVWLFATPWTVVLQSPLSLGLSRQEYWSGLACPSPGDLPNPGIKPMSLASPALAGRFFTTNTIWEAPCPPSHQFFFYKMGKIPKGRYGEDSHRKGLLQPHQHAPFSGATGQWLWEEKASCVAWSLLGGIVQPPPGAVSGSAQRRRPTPPRLTTLGWARDWKRQGGSCGVSQNRRQEQAHRPRQAAQARAELGLRHLSKDPQP